MATVWYLEAVLKFSRVCRRQFGAVAKTQTECIDAAAHRENQRPGTSAARSRTVFELVSLLYRRRAASSRSGKLVTRRLKDEAGARWRRNTRLAFPPVRPSPCSVVPATPHLLHAAPPNPSLKPSPNGKPPGPVCGGVHSPQPGPGVFPLVPA
jgi:hypothetical protein